MDNIKELFQSPPVTSCPSTFWLLNDRLDAATLRRQIQDQLNAGLKVICPHPLPKGFRNFFSTGMTESYLSDEYFENFSVIVDECKKSGLELYLYDEGGWPSGGACGQVWASDPEKFTRQYWVYDGPGKVKLVKEKVNPDHRAPLPDVLVPGATEKFIELTHERYKKYFGSEFGKMIKFAFTDEPEYISTTLRRLTWTADFAEEFKKRKGYDIVPYLPALLEFSQEAAEQLIDYHDVKAQLFTERYLLPIRDWCRRHNILSGGHMNGEDSPENMMFHTYGQILRSLRALDLPGVDVIWRQIWPGERRFPFPKFASSVANQGGNRYVLAESLGVYGAGLTFAEMKQVSSYLLLCGINIFTLAGYPMSMSGQQMQSTRPIFTPVNPLWRYFKHFSNWLARYCAIAAGSRPEVSTALFLDTRSLWSIPPNNRYSSDLQRDIALRMLENQCDFDFVDDDVLETATVEAGKIRFGEVLYDRLVIPARANFSPAAAGNLAKLRHAGAEILSSFETAAIPPVLEISPRTPNIMVRKHRDGNGNTLYFIHNTACGVTENISCRAAETGAVALADGESGNFYAIPAKNGSWQCTLLPGELQLFIIGPAAADAIPLPPAPGEIVQAVSGKWSIAKIRQYSIGEKEFIVEEFSAAPEQSVTPGDWAGVLGNGFSGSARYSIEFETANTAKFLDLGKVEHIAEVTLNGIPLGCRIAPPYIFDISAALRNGKNRLTVDVTNTLASVFNTPEVKENWLKKFTHILPYEAIEQNFEADSTTSGLHGPVFLRK